MGIKLDDLLNEADKIIEKHASAETSVQNDILSDNEKLAELLLANDEELSEQINIKVAAKETPVVETAIEKVAHALAIIETVQNLANAEKIDTFVKAAMANGHTEEQIEKFLEENNMGLAHNVVQIPEALLK